MKRLLFLLFLPVVLGSARAQQPADPDRPTPPAGPLLNAAPELSQWEISFHYPDDQKKKDPAAAQASYIDARPRKIVTTKTGRIVHELSTDVSDKTLDVWFNGNVSFVKRDGRGLWYLGSGHDSEGEPESKPLPASGFRDLEWIKADAYAGTLPYGVGNCLVFIPGVSATPDLYDPAKLRKALESQRTVAYIDADTRRPVALRLPGEMRTYQFNAAPSDMQTLPTDLADQIKRGEEGRARLQQPAPRPY